MIRFVTVVIAIGLIVYPAFLIYAMTVPVERFRTGGYVDYLAFAGTVFAIYGGVLLGVAVYWTRVGKAGQRVRPAGILKAGVWGSLVAGVIFVVGSGIHGLTTQGSFERGIGNLWGLVVIFALLFGAVVSGGMALLFRGLQPQRGTRGPDSNNR